MTPGPEREVVLQFRKCKPSDDACKWKKYATYTSNASNEVKLKYFAKGKESWWRVLVEATPQQSDGHERRPQGQAQVGQPHSHWPRTGVRGQCASRP